MAKRCSGEPEPKQSLASEATGQEGILVLRRSQIACANGGRRAWRKRKSDDARSWQDGAESRNDDGRAGNLIELLEMGSVQTHGPAAVYDDEQ